MTTINFTFHNELIAWWLINVKNKTTNIISLFMNACLLLYGKVMKIISRVTACRLNQLMTITIHHQYQYHTLQRLSTINKHFVLSSWSPFFFLVNLTVSLNLSHYLWTSSNYKRKLQCYSLSILFNLIGSQLRLHLVNNNRFYSL